MLNISEESLRLIMKIRKRGELSSGVHSELSRLYGNRYSEALRTVMEWGVIKIRFIPSLRVMWIVRGTRKDHLTIPLIYCSCEDFYLNVVVRRNVDMCHHLLAQAIAEALGRFKSVEMPDELLAKFLREWLSP